MSKYIYYPHFLLFLSISLLLLVFSTGCTKSGGEIDIFMAGDTNRDGRVDLKQDIEGASDWTEDRGAIFLNNCDSDQNTGKPDWSDKVVNGEEDLKDLAPIKIKKIKNLPQESLVSVSVDETSLKKVNLFFKNEDGRSLFPNMVNSAVLNDYLLIADPDGPVINGAYLLQE